jgi:Ser-tRNA(Ala) deacylase AlaX
MTEALFGTDAHAKARAPGRSGSTTLAASVLDRTVLHPCGGTDVADMSEIGAVRVGRIEKKGARNRRVRVGFA